MLAGQVCSYLTDRVIDVKRVREGSGGETMGVRDKTRRPSEFLMRNLLELPFLKPVVFTPPGFY